MNRAAAVLQLRPRVGRAWRGGVYAGVIGDHQLIAGPQPDAPLNWTDAMAWAAGLSAWGCSDFQLPRVAELQLLAASFPRLFPGAPWWSCETCATLPSDALVLYDANIVGHWAKHFCCAAISIRREPLPSHFTDRRFTQ